MSDSTSSDPCVRPGLIVAGKYEVLRVLGKGGAGVVVAARHVVLNRIVALKFLREQGTKLAECSEAFVGEARVMFDIANEHIVRVFDLDTLADGTPFMVMELLEGSDLRRQIVKNRVFEPGYVAELGRQICDGLAAAHARGVIHRDIKPENIFVTAGRDGVVKFKLLDFGISRESTRSETWRGRSDLTSGTPAYMSPEQVRGSSDFDSRSDIWSLGCVLYEMLTGASPFEGSTPEQCCAAVLDKRPTPIRVRRPDLDPRLESIVMRCLSKQPRFRFSTAVELRTALTLWACTAVGGILEGEPHPIVSSARSDTASFRHLKTVAGGKRVRRHVPSALLAIGGGICLTLFSIASTSPATSSQSNNMRSDDMSGESLSIVLIEDHDDGREMMAALLRGWGHRVEVAVDGESGIALIERIDPDVVFVDLGLPRQNGYAVTQHVRRKQRGKSPRLVAFTGFADDSHKRRALEAGFDQYLVKPASLDAIRRALAD